MSLLSAELQAFLAIVRNHTVMGASRELGLTQTGVTQRLRKLEGQLGVTLFTRSRTGMRLTGEGKALLRYCEGARELEGETLARLSGTREHLVVAVTIAGPSSVLRSRVIPACASLRTPFPGLRFRFDLVDDERLEPLLKTGAAELVVLPPERVTLELDSKMIKPETYKMVVPTPWSSRKIHELVKEEQIIDFDPRDEMTHSYLKAFGLLDIARHDRQFANNTDAIASMVSQGMGYSVLAAEFAQEWVDRKQLAWLKPSQTLALPLALAWYPRPQMPAYFKAIIDSVR
jgi:LysR family transcriptional regulator, chromosome initiation inhibitor